MAFPASRLPVTVEIAPGADLSDASAGWVYTDITSRVRFSKRLGRYIRISQGADDEATRVEPSRCAMWLDNRSGDFTPRNPLGTYYGTLGRNTPLRVSIRRAEDDFDRTASSEWGTEPLWGGTWTVSGGAASDYSVSGGTGRQSLGTVGILRHSLLDIGQTNARLLMEFTNPVVPTGAAISHWVLGRVTDTNNYYLAQVNVATTGAVTLFLFKRVAGALTLLASGVSVGTHSAGNTWRVLFDYVGSTLRAKAWKTTDSEPTAWQVEATDTALTTGTQIGLAARTESGNTNGTVVIQWDNLTISVDRFSGFVSAWPPRWDKSGNDATVPIEANGVLRRLGQGQPPALSPLARAILASDPVAYWPCEDGEAAQMVGSGLPGGVAATLAGPTPTFSESRYAPDVPYGTQAMVDLSAGGTIAGSLGAAATAATANGWTVHGWFETAPTLGGDLVMIEWDTPGGTYVKWQFGKFTTGLGSREQVRAFTAAGAMTEVIDTGGWQQALWPYDIVAVQDGANIDITFNQMISGSFWTASIAGTLAGVTVVRVNPGAVVVPFLVGHATVWDITTTPYRLWAATDSYGVSTDGARLSWLNETASDRLVRLCAEQGVTLTMPAVSADFITRMGPQPAGTFTDLAYECPEADQGVLHESGFGLGYVPREARYNRTVALALDFAQGQIAEPPEPADDDQQLRNRVTVRRTGGSSAVAEDTESVAEDGLYDDEVTVNHRDDTQLADHAAWRVHLGTVDEMRWPRIDVNLAAAPELVDQWLACGVQSRVTAISPPDEVAGDDIDVIVEGYSETLGYKDWLVELNCSPARPWDVATADGEPRVAADGSTLATGNTQASARGNAPDRVILNSGDAALFGVGNQVVLHDNTGARKEPTVFTVTSITPPAFGFQDLVLSPLPRGQVEGDFVGGFDTVHRVDETSLSIASPSAGSLWTTDPTDFPLDVNVGGERITLSGISGTTSPQTATVSARAVNGIAKAHDAGAEVQVWQPAVVAL